MRKKLTDKKLDHLAEEIRRYLSPKDTYDHLLETIADDVYKEFEWLRKEHGGEEAMNYICEYIRKWRP